jgi:TetR/AcrR family transcriptional repressor of nem operon
VGCPDWKDAGVVDEDVHFGGALGECAHSVGRLEISAHELRLATAGLERWEEHLRDGLTRMRTRGKLRKDADPAALATATMASIQGGLLLTQIRRDPHQLRIALNAARNNLRVAAA